jgi:hypothetical protein
MEVEMEKEERKRRGVVGGVCVGVEAREIERYRSRKIDTRREREREIS